MAERIAPAIDWMRTALIALVTIVGGVGAWEWSMRQAGLTTRDLGNSNAAWARERRRVAAAESDVIIIGSSRLMFNLDTALWGRMTGTTPIQLAREGTSPRPVLADLAKDSSVRGLIVIGYDPRVFFGSGARGADLVKYAQDEPLFKRSGLSLYDPLAGVFAFLDDRMHPMSWIERLDVPQRTMRGAFNEPWKLSESGLHRNSWIWSRVESDAAYRTRAEAIWLLPPPPGARPTTVADIRKAIDEVARDVALIRRRGGEVMFIRSPSDGELLIQEDKRYPRALAWDNLISRTGAIGLYWTDDPELARLRTVELSHLSRADRPVFTRRVVELLHVELTRRNQFFGGLGRKTANKAPAP